MTRQALRLTDQGPQRALADTRQIELISETYRIHTLTKRLLRRQLPTRSRSRARSTSS